MRKFLKLNKIVVVLIVTGMIFQAILPSLLSASSYGEPLPPTIHELIEESELILVVKPTKIKLGGKSRGRYGGLARVQVLEVWKGSLKKREFTINWGPYNAGAKHFVFGERIHGMAKYILFLKRERRRRFFIGAIGDFSFWPLQKIQFPGLKDKREAVAYQNSASHFNFNGTGQVLLRDTATKQMKNGERVYRKAILLNEFRMFVKEVLETLELKKITNP